MTAHAFQFDFNNYCMLHITSHLHYICISCYIDHLLCVQSLDALVKTLVDLCGKSTQIVMCYEERTTGNKPEIEKKFFKVRVKWG